MRKYFLLLLLCSCNVKTGYFRPEVETPTSWRFSPEKNEEYVNLEWWKQFNDPALDRLIELAFENNQDLQKATARVMDFFSRYRVTASELFPQVYLDGGVDRIKLSQDVNFQPPVPFVPRINTLYHLFANLLSYEVDFWGKIRNKVEAAKSNYFAQVNARRNVMTTLVASVAQSFFSLKQYDRQLEISKQTLESRLQSLDIATKRYNVGLISAMEVKQAESQAQDAEIQMKTFKELIARSEDFISVLVGMPPHAIDHGISLIELKLPESLPAGMPSDLLQNRPDIMQAEELLIAANANIGVARAAFFPKINLTGVLGQRSTATHDFLHSSATLFDGGASVSQPVFTGGKLPGELDAAKAQYEEALHNYQQTILTAFQEVDDALISLEVAKEKVAIHEKELVALEEYLKLSRLRYDNGQNDYLTVLNSETSLFVVQLSEVVNRASTFTSLVSLYKALGQGWKKDQDVIPVR